MPGYLRHPCGPPSVPPYQGQAISRAPGHLFPKSDHVYVCQRVRCQGVDGVLFLLLDWLWKHEIFMGSPQPELCDLCRFSCTCYNPSKFFRCQEARWPPSWSLVLPGTCSARQRDILAAAAINNLVLSKSLIGWDRPARVFKRYLPLLPQNSKQGLTLSFHSFNTFLCATLMRSWTKPCPEFHLASITQRKDPETGLLPGKPPPPCNNSRHSCMLQSLLWGISCLLVSLSLLTARSQDTPHPLRYWQL